MKIEITDREKFKVMSKNAMASIMKIRASMDAVYEARYAAQRGFFRWLFRLPPKPVTKKPPENWPRYPSINGWKMESWLKEFDLALNSEGTGTISIKGDDLHALESWQK